MESGKQKNISLDFARACAKYLQRPTVDILRAAGSLTPEDLSYEPADLNQELPRLLESIREDKEFGPLMPKELGADPTLHYFIVRLYEEARGVQLLPKELSAQRVEQAFRAIETYRTRWQRDS